MFSISEDHERHYSELIIERYSRSMSDVNAMCYAMNTRSSVINRQNPNEKINPENLQEVLNALDNHDYSKWHIHDPGRFGGSIRELLKIPDKEFQILLNIVKPSQIFKLESAYCFALGDNAYVASFHNIQNLSENGIHLHCSSEGKLTYHVKTNNEIYSGTVQIPIDKYDIEQLNTDIKYANTVLPEILQIIAQINPNHLDPFIINGFFQKYCSITWSTNDIEDLIAKKNEFIQKREIEISKYILQDLLLILTPSINNFKQCLNLATLELLEKTEDKPLLRIQVCILFMYKQNIQIREIMAFLVEIHKLPSEKQDKVKEYIEKINEIKLDELPLSELDILHHALKTFLIESEPDWNNAQDSIPRLKEQIFQILKFPLSEPHNWFSRKNQIEINLEQALTPSAIVRSYKEMQSLYDDIQSSIKDLQETYELLWHQLDELNQKYLLPILNNGYISPQDLLQLSKKDCEYQIEKFNALIPFLQNASKPFSSFENLERFINVNELQSNYLDKMNQFLSTSKTIDQLENEELIASKDHIFSLSPHEYHKNLQKLDYLTFDSTFMNNLTKDERTEPTITTEPTESTETIERPGILKFVSSIFNQSMNTELVEEKKYKYAVIPEVDLERLKMMCIKPFQLFLEKKTDTEVSEKKLDVANNAIQKINTASSTEEIEQAIDTSINSAQKAKISWFGSKKGELIIACEDAKKIFDEEIAKKQPKPPSAI